MLVEREKFIYLIYLDVQVKSIGTGRSNFDLEKIWLMLGKKQ